jgi:hypothetical protein
VKDVAILVGEMVIAFLIVDLLKDGVKAFCRWAWNWVVISAMTAKPEAPK